jgi:hypothetical protein
MSAPSRKPGRVVMLQRPPPKIFLGLGAGFLALNHLSVVLGGGLQPEAVMLGSWLVLMGGWVLAAARTFDAAWAWADPSGRRVIGFVLLTMAVAFGLADGIAWFAYGQHL